MTRDIKPSGASCCSVALEQASGVQKEQQKKGDGGMRAAACCLNCYLLHYQQ